MSYRAMNWAWNLTDLGMAESFILVSLADQANDDGFCWPSQATLAARSRQSERSVRRNLARLEEYGLIKVMRRSTQGGRQSNLYWLNVGADFSLQTNQPDNLAGCEKPVDNSPVESCPVDDLDEVEQALSVANKATGQSGRLRNRTECPVAQPDTGDRSQPDTGGRLQYRGKNHQEEPPNRTEPNQVSEGARETGPVRFGSDRPHGESGPGADAPAVQPVSMPVAGLDEADAALVLACLPAWMHPMDAPGARHVAGMLRERVEAGWEPEQIREALSAQPPRSVGRLSKLVEYRIKMNVLVALAPRRAAVVSLQQRRDAETSRAERAKARSEALARQGRRDEEADRRWSEAMEQARAQMPGASHLEVAQAAHRMLTTPSPVTGARLKGGGKPTQAPPVKTVSATAYDAK